MVIVEVCLKFDARLEWSEINIVLVKAHTNQVERIYVYSAIGCLFKYYYFIYIFIFFSNFMPPNNHF